MPMPCNGQFVHSSCTYFYSGGLAHPRKYTFDHGWGRAELRASLPVHVSQKSEVYLRPAPPLMKQWWCQISNPAFDYRYQAFSVKILELERATHPPPLCCQLAYANPRTSKFNSTGTCKKYRCTIYSGTASNRKIMKNMTYRVLDSGFTMHA